MSGKDGIKTLEAGYITIDRDSGPPVRIPLRDLLRNVDIPTGLTHAQVDGLRLLSNMVVILIRTLIDRGIIDENMGDNDSNWDLDTLIHSIESLGGSFDTPDMDNVEVA